VNIGVFFPLLFLAAYHLPGGLAATMQASSPLAVMAVALWLLRERPGRARVVGALVGLVGVSLLVLRAGATLDAVGLAAAFGSVAVSAVGFVLVKRWRPPVDMVTLVSWQLVAGGIVLVPVAAMVEGAPPVLDARAVVGLTWIAAVGTVVAYVAWFRGLTLMPAGATALIGLLNPVVGTALGVVVAKEVFGWSQALGMFLVLGGVLAGQPAVVQWWRRASGRRSLDAREASRELGSGPGEALPVVRRRLDELPRA
jgi:probable blue pigment (indigoidine) exporter